MDDEALTFTTELGKNWVVWQAFRELASNTKDEGGVISDKPQKGDTVIIVDGPEIMREYHDRDSIFVASKPLDGNDFIEVHPGETQRNAHLSRPRTMPKGLKYTYNILHGCTLTEDRTFQSQFDVEWKLCTLLPKLTHRGVLNDLLAGGEKFDQNLTFSHCGSPSSEFLEVAAQHYTNSSANRSAKNMVERDMQNRASFPAARLSDAESAKFLSAFAILAAMDCTLSPEDVEVVETLGPSVMGMYHKGKHQVYLAKHTIDFGVETVAATLFEEWLHKEYKYEDNSRAMQDYLLQRLVAVLSGGTVKPPVIQTPEMPF